MYRVYQAKKHRRQHNIFDIGDLYVFTEKYSKQSVIHKVDSLNSGKGCIRHATPEEITAGRRLWKNYAWRGFYDPLPPMREIKRA